MKFRKTLMSLAAAAMMLPTLAIPDDIDLYTGGEQFAGGAANVLIVLDNSANWASANQKWPDGAKQGVSELETLSEVVGSLTDSINVGLMTFAQSGADMGGQVRYHVRSMNATNRSRFQQIMDHMKANAVGSSDPDEVSQSTDYDSLMNSAFRYFNGLGRWKDVNAKGDRRDFPDNAATGTFDPNPNPSGYTWGYTSAAATTYNPPSDAPAFCAKNYIIFIGNGFPSNVGSASELTAAAALVSATADTNVVTPISPKNPWADEWARFMYKKGVRAKDENGNPAVDAKGEPVWNGIVTYTIDVCKDACEAPQETLLRSMAKVGGGKYFKSTSKSEISAALTQIFAEIQAVNSVFASATLPVSVNTQGTYENQVYIGVFRPDGAARPRWFGNIKGYQFARYCDFNGNNLVDDVGAEGDERIDGNSTPPSCTGDTLKLFLADRNNKPAIDQTLSSGFIDQQATSFWTQSSTFWAFSPNEIAGASDSPDGPTVERGAAAQKLREKWATSTSPDGRNVYTCLDGCLSGSGTAKALSSAGNQFVTTNSAVTGALTVPSGSVSVSLARAGNTVTATTSTAHGFNPGDSVTIAGATPTAYNGAFTVLTKPNATSFTYEVTETPSNTVVGVSAAATAGTLTLSQLDLSTTTPGATATVTATTAPGVAAGTTSATIVGAPLAALNGTFTGTTAAGKFSYTTTLPSNPSATLSGTATVKCGTNATETATGSWSSATGKFTFTKSPSGQFVGCKNYTGSVTVSGASDSAYNGIWTIAGSDKGTSSFSAGTLAAVSISSSYNTAGMTLTPAGATNYTVDLNRPAGSTTVTATVQAAGTHTIANGETVVLSGSADAAYNGNFVVTVPNNQQFTFTVTTGPTSPPTGTITASMTGSSSGPSSTNLVSWMRGKDLWEDENQSGTLTDVRASIHGDVLHSRPLLINYGGTTGIYGFYGSNDGFLRAIKGGTANSDGGEQWAFIPSEFVNYTKLRRLYENSTLVRYPNSSCPASGSPTPLPRPYFWDGQLSAYQSDDLQTTYLFAGMRRGGRSVYAFDVSVPTAPIVMWRINEASSGFSQLGYTWSEPRVVWIKDVTQTSGKRLVLIFGAGYDPTDDDQRSGAVRGDRAGYTGIGRGVFVVDALTGALVKFLEPPSGVRKYSFAADVTTFDYDGDGLVDRIYAVDTGAQVFRFDQNGVNSPAADNGWVAYHLANFGDVAADGGSDARRFLYPPEVLPFVYTKVNTASGAKTLIPAMMVLVGSGDREKPLPNFRRDPPEDPNSTTFLQNSLTCSALYSDTYFGTIVDDRFYGMVDDVPALGAPSAVITESNLQQINPGAISDPLVAYNICYAFQTDCTPAQADGVIKKGWMVDFKLDPDGGGYGEEKLVNAPTVVSGVTFFATNAPQTPNIKQNVCSNLGVASSYAVSPFTGMPAFDRNGDGVLDASDFAATVTGGGLPPSVTAGVVGIDHDGDGDADSFHRFVIGAGGEGESSLSPIEGAKNPITLKGTRSRVFWFYPTDTN